MGMPNFFKIGEGVVKGVFDIGFGIGEFAVDTVKAGTQLLTDGPDVAAQTFISSVQEDLLGRSLQGAFGPQGVIGSVIGELPEFIRCLLYTSPSPRDRTRSRMPSSA